MPFRKILVPVTGAGEDKLALAAAFAAARPFHGHVQALFVFPDPREAVPFVGMPVPAEIVQQIIDNADAVARTAARAARANLAAAAESAGIEVVDLPRPAPLVTCSFREVQGGFVSQTGRAARLADLVAFGPMAQAGGPDLFGAFVETLTVSGRPVLIGAHAPVADLTRRIAAGWDGGVAAAHALTAALPFLACAGAVDVVSVAPAESVSADGAIEYLSLHGIRARPRTVDPAGSSPGEALLKAAAEGGASLLVLGGYGHSRLSETLFGGTTVHIAAHATLPLFMAH